MYDFPLSYLIGADEDAIEPDAKRLIEGPYDAPPLNGGGQDIAYCNLFHEDYATEGPIYAPYLPDDDTSSQYGEGRIDPRGDGWRKNLDRQYALRREQSHTVIELDNPDSYEDYFDAVLAELDLCGFDVVAKNPVILAHEHALAYVRHPRVVGMVIEQNDIGPIHNVEYADQLRRQANKPTLPIWFVTFGKSTIWAEQVAKAAKGYNHIGVTHSAKGEYETVDDILPFQESTLADPPKWLQVMRAASGTVETPGAADNPKIMAMADSIAADYPEMTSYCAQYTHDSIPWCGLAAAYAMSEAGVRPPFGRTDTDKFLWARAWDHAEGFPRINSPRLGCVVVMERSGGGHVTFYERTEGDRYVCTGGNQSDAINTTSFPTSGVVALTWPGESVEPPPPPGERRELKEGMTGPDVAALQTVLGLPADGEFGPVTETQVMAFQKACNIDADGEVGPQTWEQVDALAAKMAAGDSGLSKDLEAKIIEIANDSAISKYNWPGRGMPPPGYIDGMALCFGAAVKEYQDDNPAMLVAGQAAGNADKDALAFYANQFAAHGMSNATAGLDTLRHLFVMMIGLGMRESSGNYSCGKDASASNTTADTCEAGFAQTSYNIRAANPTIAPLLPAYWADPQGFLLTFAQGIDPTSANLAVYGSGDGARYQFLSKYSPAFHAMVTAVGMRVLRKHWGPINRSEVEIRPEADVLLLAVQHAVLAAPIEPPPPIEPPVGEEAEVIITVRTKGAVKVSVVEMEDISPDAPVPAVQNKAPAVQATGGTIMTHEQILGLVRAALQFIGGVATALGWLTAEQVGQISAVLLQIAGPLMLIAGAVWSVLSNSKESIIKMAAAMPETKVEGNSIKVLDPTLARAASQAGK